MLMLGRCRNAIPGHLAVFPRECRVWDGAESGIGTAAAPFHSPHPLSPVRSGVVPLWEQPLPTPSIDLKALNEASSVSGLRSCFIEWFNIALEELGWGAEPHVTLPCVTQPTSPCRDELVAEDTGRKRQEGSRSIIASPRVAGGSGG